MFSTSTDNYTEDTEEPAHKKVKVTSSAQKEEVEWVTDGLKGHLSSRDKNRKEVHEMLYVMCAKFINVINEMEEKANAKVTAKFKEEGTRLYEELKCSAWSNSSS